MDARRPVTEIAEYAGVSDNTVRNRMRRLEDRGVIQGYSADIDYHRTGIRHSSQFVCTARMGEPDELADRARDIPGVVEVGDRHRGGGGGLPVAFRCSYCDHAWDVTF